MTVFPFFDDVVIALVFLRVHTTDNFTNLELFEILKKIVCVNSIPYQFSRTYKIEVLFIHREDILKDYHW